MNSVRRRLALCVALSGGLVGVATASAAELTVMSSGGYTAALQMLAPVYEKQTGDNVQIVLGPSMGTANEAIPNRLARGENADLVIMVGYALEELVAKGVVAAETRIDLVDSKIALCVRAGARRPDIGTLAAFKAALLAAKSIAYSDSASGVYIEREMFAKLGLEPELKPKARMIIAERVGNVVARGDAEVGFQQMSELLPVEGIDIVGFIPAEVQKGTIFSAGIPSAAKNPTGAKAFLAFLATPSSRAVAKKSGLEPLPAK